ncbi:MAG: hypothetical protein RML12_07110 [Xanthomonadales bacterium]|nr:hypothetical protein [Xanthomonadales bacterium]
MPTADTLLVLVLDRQADGSERLLPLRYRLRGVSGAAASASIRGRALVRPDRARRAAIGRSGPPAPSARSGSAPQVPAPPPARSGWRSGLREGHG